MLEVDESQFEREVLEASHRLPVLVDFWATWCAPCRALGPVLERLEDDYAGRFRLAKVDSDANPQLSARYQVRSIPFVLAFVAGEPVDGFVGVQSESQVRAFIDRLLPTPSELERLRARQLAERGEKHAAIAALRSAVLLDPGNAEAQLDLAEQLMSESSTSGAEPADLDEAGRALAAAGGARAPGARGQALETRLRSLRALSTLPDFKALEQRVAADPADLHARLALAQRLIAEGRYEPALEQLLQVIARDRRFGDDAARRMALAVFELAADQPKLVAAYRRRLSALLNR